MVLFFVQKNVNGIPDIPLDFLHVGLSVLILHMHSLCSSHEQFFKMNYLFVFGCAGSSLLCGLFSSCSGWGLHSSCSVWTSHCGASLLVEHRLQWVWRGLSSCVSQALEHRLSSVAHGLSCPTTCGIFLGQGFNLCLLH